MRTLWLASGSPRRAALLQQAGVPFQRLPAPGVDESVLPGEAPGDYVERLAQAKARAGWQALSAGQQQDAVVLGADTSVVLGDGILGKPASDEEAVRMLARLSGAEHQVMSAVSLVWGQQQACRLSTTRVRFRSLDEDEIRRYVATGEGRDKAGSYAIQGLGALLVEALSGSYSGVVGLPLEACVALFKLAEVAFWQGPDQMHD